MSAKADRYVRQLVAAKPNLLIPHYLIHSWLYYERDLTVVSDAVFDEICKSLVKRLPELTHVHKHVVDPAYLSAGTGYYLGEIYPPVIPGAAWQLYKMFNPKAKLVR